MKFRFYLSGPEFHLKGKSTIRKNIAFFLLLLFFIGSLPKAYFHDLVADHVDTASCDQKHTQAVLHKQSFNCHFDDLVINSPFVTSSVQDNEAAAFHFESTQSASVSSYQYSFVQHKENRGPPSLPVA